MKYYVEYVENGINKSESGFDNLDMAHEWAEVQGLTLNHCPEIANIDGQYTIVKE